MKTRSKFALTVLMTLVALTPLISVPVRASERIAEVDTAFKLLGPNHKIIVEAYDDPVVKGVTCHLSRAKTGGLTGLVGLAEDLSEASIACRQIGPVSFQEPLKQVDEVFDERLSVLFKKLRVVRIVDAQRNTLVYLTYSDRLIDGSPQNSITSIPIDPKNPIPVR